MRPERIRKRPMGEVSLNPSASIKVRDTVIAVSIEMSTTTGPQIGPVRKIGNVVSGDEVHNLLVGASLVQGARKCCERCSDWILSAPAGSASAPHGITDVPHGSGFVRGWACWRKIRRKKDWLSGYRLTTT